jgi:hypothetical protein
MFTGRSTTFLAVFFIALLCTHAVFGQLGGLGSLTSLINGLLSGLLGSLPGGSNLLNLINQLVQQLSGGGQGCGILASLLGGCSGQSPCCGCCTQNSTGVNSVCATIGLLDFLVGTSECPTGSIVACTGQVCQAGQTCNVLNLANLACVNVG